MGDKINRYTALSLILERAVFFFAQEQGMQIINRRYANLPYSQIPRTGSLVSVLCTVKKYFITTFEKMVDKCYLVVLYLNCKR